MSETALERDVRESDRQVFDRSRLRTMALPFLFLLVFVTIIASLSVGPLFISFGEIADVARFWWAVEPQTDNVLRAEVILIDIRLPRMILGCLIGAALAVSGALMQGLFRNPLADPGLIGVSAGAALAAVCVIVLAERLNIDFGPVWSAHLLPVAAFLGGLLMTLLLYSFANRAGQTSIATMLLAGIALGALSSAVTGFLIFVSTDQQLRDFTFWSMGSLGGASWQKITAFLPFMVALFIAIPFLGKGLNAMLLGEAAAFHLGYNTERLKRVVIVLAAAATGASVASAGAIGFVGIVVPHLLRLAIGPDHRLLLPCCALLGAALLVAADILCRIVVAPAELPIGIIMAVLGAPVFLFILLRRRSVIDI